MEWVGELEQVLKWLALLQVEPEGREGCLVSVQEPGQWVGQLD